MATWRTIASTEVDPDSPVTATLMEALADNPIAITERATGAPKVKGSLVGYQVFTISDTYTPTTDVTMVEVIVTGGGGGSDGTVETAGGGGTSIIIIDLAAAGATEATITVGLGGTSSGTDGGPSTWNDNGTTPTITSTGGEGTSGETNSSVSGGAGSASADIAIDGSSGGTEGTGGSYWGGSSGNAVTPYGGGAHRSSRAGGDGIVVVKEFY